MNDVSIYIHIPFCKSICSYCDFCKLLYNEKWIDLYLDSLEKEIKSYNISSKAKTLYIGGGTPSSLNEKCLEKLFNMIAEAMGYDSVEKAQSGFSSLLSSLELPEVNNIKEEDFDLLKNSVNPVRLKNNPVGLTEDAINNLYHEILGR